MRLLLCCRADSVADWFFVGSQYLWDSKSVKMPDTDWLIGIRTKRFEFFHSEFRIITRRNDYQLYTKNYKINYLTMASSTLGLTLNRAPFPLVKEVLTEESMFIEISTKVQVGGQGNNIQWEKHTAKIRKINHLNKELMMNSIIEFEDACAAGRLNLSNGEKIYSRFWELLGEVFRADWDNAHQGKANSVAGFHETFNEFISYHFSNTDLIDQKNMLAKAKKPFKYTVKVLCSRLRHLNKLMSKLPGANNMLP
jgi:hypothetical protein